MCRNTSTMLMPLNLFPLYLSIFTPYYITLKYLSSVFPKPQSPHIVQCVSTIKLAYSLWWTIFSYTMDSILVVSILWWSFYYNYLSLSGACGAYMVSQGFSIICLDHFCVLLTAIYFGRHFVRFR